MQTIGGTQRIFNVLPRPPFNTYLMIIGYDYAIGGGAKVQSQQIVTKLVEETRFFIGFDAEFLHPLYNF